VTSILAAMISFHKHHRALHVRARREGCVQRRSADLDRTGSPVTGSIIQSIVGFVVIVSYPSGLGPVVRLFSGRHLGGIGVLLLIFITSLSVIVFFPATGRRVAVERAIARCWHRVLAVVLFLAVKNFAPSRTGRPRRAGLGRAIAY